ncbi:MAG: exo-alpha-sialidase [Bacteroidales bacterium]|nr:exo-alpha-sialidase [Bacteroidales bacterium]
MKTHTILSSFLLFIMASTNMLYGQTKQENIKHIKVYYEPGMFGGFPANHGIWIWDNEILVGFSQGFYKDLGERHNIDREKTVLRLLARSLDGGETWKIEDPGKSGALVLPDSDSYNGIVRKVVQPLALIDCNEDINFEHPDFCLTARMTNIHSGQSHFWYSYDWGHSWEGPSKLPNFGTKGTAARTDYIIDSKNKCMLFITAVKSNGKEGRTLCVETTDGGKNWSFVSWIGPEPEGFSIMPASVRLSAHEILVTVRRRERSGRFIAGYLSSDNGRTWSHLDNPVEDTGIGNPPAMVKMRDGRICLVYGYRAEPNSSIRAKISSDNGKTWSKDYFLRDDGSGQDIGYPRVVQRPDGKIVALYYFEDKETGHERYIGATIWDTPAVGEE